MRPLLSLPDRPYSLRDPAENGGDVRFRATFKLRVEWSATKVV